jgi:hypothetical protein
VNRYQFIAFQIGVIVVSTLVSSNSFLLAKNKHDILHGLKGLRVVVESLEAEIERDGLTTDQVQTDTELKLRMAGIKILPFEGVAIDKPFFYLNIGAMKTRSGVYIYTISAKLQEPAICVRNDYLVLAATWEHSGYVGITPNLATIRQTAKDMVDKFINAYLSANPK